MIGINTFSTTVGKFVGKDVQSMLAATQHTEGGLRASLAALTGEIDSAMKTGVKLNADLGARRDYIERLLTKLDDGHPLSDIEDLPSNLRVNTGIGNDPVVAVVDQLQATGSRFDNGLDAAMDGALLLDTSNPDDLIRHLKSASSFWDNDMIKGQADEIEFLLRNGNPVNANAGSLLAQPIATARIPVGSSKDGIAHTDMHLIPDRVVSPPQGFSSLEEARAAAINFIQGSPGSTAIAVHDAGGAIHLLGAPTDTGKRTIQVARKLRSATEKQLDVQVRVNHPNVDAVFRSDNTDIRRGGKGFLEGSWPEGHLWPASVDSLKEKGFAKVHQSVTNRLNDELGRVTADQEKVSKLNDDLAAQRRIIRDQRMQAEQFSQIKDHPGKGGPETWEIEPALHYGDEDGHAVFEYSPDFDGFTKALPGFTVEDAVQLATRSEITDPSLMTAVMQDSTGTPHLAAISYGQVDKKGIGNLHPDMRALYRPITGELNFRPSGDSSELSFLSVPHKSIDLAFQDGDLGSQLGIAELGKGWTSAIEPFSETMPIKFLPAGNPQTATKLAYEEVKGLSKGPATNLVVRVPVSQHGREVEVYGMVRAENSSHGWNRSYEWLEKAHPKIIGAVDDKGIVFTRES